MYAGMRARPWVFLGGMLHPARETRTSTASEPMAGLVWTEAKNNKQKAAGSLLNRTGTLGLFANPS